jgi:hypothetical protein
VSRATTNLALPLIAAGQAQKHVTHNEALLTLDALLHCAVKDKDLATPPGSPAEGDRYIVAAAPSGAWAGKAANVAAWQDGTWRFHAPKAGWIAFVVDELQLYHFNGSAWAPGVLAITNLQNLTSLGIGTAADAANPFSTKLDNVLHAAKTVAEGGTDNIQVKLSKESAAKTASYLFQDNFSGRAELGLAGDDDFHVKVSPDGAAWTEALLVNRTTGAVALAAGSTGTTAAAGTNRTALATTAFVEAGAARQAGQCRLAKSGANLLLARHNGHRIVINGAAQTIPAAGLSLAAAGLTPDTTYFIYAFMNAGVMTLEPRPRAMRRMRRRASRSRRATLRAPSSAWRGRSPGQPGRTAPRSASCCLISTVDRSSSRGRSRSASARPAPRRSSSAPAPGSRL